jgi:predicted chitinase
MQLFFYGVVENRMDPLKLGRCQVRIVDIHTHDKNLLPTSDLPWAYPMGDINSASMNGIGESPLGPVEGTTVIVFFADADTMQQPIMMGTLGGIPQGEHAIDNTEAELMLSPETEAKTEIPLTTSDGRTVSSSDGTAVTTETTPPPAQPQTAKAIPGDPPFGPRPGSNVKISGAAVKGILAVGKAMDAAGITSSYARAAILGIIGGECEWIPQVEGHRYNPKRLSEVFSWMSSSDVSKYANWQGDPFEFFSFVYGPTTRSGKNLGNKTSEEGGKYCGRGFIQLTGASNYKRYAQLSGIDIISNPLLLNDYDKGALVAVSYFRDRVKKAENDPGYFEAACRAVGHNVPNIKQKKFEYYQYFLLGDTVAAKEEAPPEQLDATPGSQPGDVPMAANGLPSDRQAALNTGFRDPNMKYPLRGFLHEPDTNRLSRGVTRGTSVQIRDNMRTTGVDKADGTTFDQPPVPYNAKYPFNWVRQSESGHIMEFDDTPGNERINWMHRVGTFLEIDVNGTQVNRIVGDGYTIIDRNGYISIKGACSITAEGVTNILIKADANLVVEGHADIQLRQDADMKIAGDYNLVVGGDMKTTVIGSQTTSVGGSFAVHAAGASVKAPSIILDGNLPFVDSGPDTIRFLIGPEGQTLTPDSPPEQGTPTNNVFSDLHTPTRNFEDDTLYETPDEVESDEGIAFHQKRDSQIIGEKTKPEEAPAEEEAEVVPNNTQPTNPSCDLIFQMKDFPMGMKLSKNFTLSNFIADPKHVLTDLNLLDGTTQRLYTKQEIVCNLKGLAENVGEKLLELIPGGRKGFVITSGYRYQPGSKSDHPKGNAMDIVLSGANYDYQAHYEIAKKLAAALPYHQLILEYRDPAKSGGKRIVWIHISHRYQGATKHAFTMLNDKTYGQGFHLLA